MMFRKPLIVLLGLGVLAGYGSAFGHLRHRWHGGGPYGEGGCDRWSQRWDAPAPVAAPTVTAPAPAPAPAPQQQLVPQIIIVQPQAVPAAQAPTVIVQPPAPAAAPNVTVTVPSPSAAPKAEDLKAKAPSAE